MVQWLKLWDPDVGRGNRVGFLVRELDPTWQLRKKKKEEEEGEKQQSWGDRDKKRALSLLGRHRWPHLAPWVELISMCF